MTKSISEQATGATDKDGKLESTPEQPRALPKLKLTRETISLIVTSGVRAGREPPPTGPGAR